MLIPPAPVSRVLGLRHALMTLGTVCVCNYVALLGLASQLVLSSTGLFFFLPEFFFAILKC